MRNRVGRVIAVAAALMIVASGATAGASGQAARGTKVKVTLSEWLIKATPERVRPGKVTFVVKNAGADTHEFVVVKGSDPADFATDEHGKILEKDIAKADRVGEVADILAGKTKKVNFKLKFGEYILFCNIYDEDEGEAHFDEGMVTTFTVG